MPITQDPARRVLSLHTDRSTYQMRVDEHGYLLHLHYGARTDGDQSHLLTYADRGGVCATPHDVADRTYSLDFLPQEFPSQGSGDFREPLLVVRDAEGTFGCDLRYQGHEVRDGLFSLPGLPTVYDGEDRAQTLSVTLTDPVLGLEVELLYGTVPSVDVIVRAAVLRNRGDRPVTVERFQSANLDLVTGRYDLLTFHGRHAMEHVLDRSELGPGVRAVGSRRGASSHEYNPCLILADHEATETGGRCWALELMWSGGFKATAERDQFQQTRVTMGLDDELFSYRLEPGQELVAPEVIMSFSGAGLGRLTQNLHRCLREHVCRGPWRDKPRPVVINSWETHHFDFTGDDLVALAEKAAGLGIELLVMDDGWFGQRNDDTSSLGDWTVNEEKLGGTLAELCQRVNDAGVGLGIWIEPEMVNEESELFRAHPDWAMTVPGRAPVLGRDQLMLDLSRADVRDYLFHCICSVLDQAPIPYLKWDFNRCIVDVHSSGAADQGAVLYDYVLGLYDLLERVTRRYPDLLIEGCAGGGGRFDAGMLAYTPQIWTSDNTDPVNRTKIQQGTLFGYPASCLSAHVSASPNELNYRETPFDLRGTVALEGAAFGYELNLLDLTDAECDAVREQVRLHHEIDPLVREGDYWRLSAPERGLDAWSFVAPDGSSAVIGASLLDAEGYGQAVYVTPRGLTPGAWYRGVESRRLYSADALMDAGLTLPMAGVYANHVFRLERVDEPGEEG